MEKGVIIKMEKFLDRFVWVLALLVNLRVIEIKILVNEVVYMETLKKILDNMDWSS